MLIMKQLNEYSTLRNFSYRPILHRIGGGNLTQHNSYSQSQSDDAPRRPLCYVHKRRLLTIKY